MLLATATANTAAAGSDALWPDISRPSTATYAGFGDAAVVIGISDYDRLSDVPGAEQNAEDWYTWLTKGRGISPSKVQLIEDSAATKETIEAAAKKASAQVQAGGTLWFIYIGHGAPAVSGRDGVLVGSDARPTADSLYARSVSQSELLASLEEGKQKQTVAIMDTSFSGKDATGQPLVPGLQPLIPTTALNTRSATVLSAGASDQFAGSLPGADRPAFSYLILGGLRGWADKNNDGRVSAKEVLDYSQEALGGTVSGRAQVPGGNGAMSMMLAQGRERGPDLANIRLRVRGAQAMNGMDNKIAALEQKRAEAQKEAMAASRLSQEIQEMTAAMTLPLRQRAMSEWNQVRRFAAKGDALGKEALGAYIDAYDNVHVNVAGQQVPVHIPQVALAR
jgi:hypothetical protein